MSIFRSYFNRNNTIVSNSYVNTGRNPVVQLNFGSTQNIIAPSGFSRFIFDIDLTELQGKIATGEISTGCTGYSGITHTLTMTNSSSFDEELLNTYMSDGARRATSFDLILFRIPKVSGSTGSPQTWDEGVGYDYYDFKTTRNSSTGELTPTASWTDKAFSDRASNWFQRSTILDWSVDGIYDNTNSLTGLTGCNFSALTILDVQHFEFGDEDINFDMTSEINAILSGSLTGVTGWGIAYLPQIENITGLTENYSVGFFSQYTQTFYQPYLLTNYDDYIDDDRNTFTIGRTNKLYLYVYQNGDFTNLDVDPEVDITDANGVVIPGLENLSTCLRTRGVYEVSIPNEFGAYPVPCMFNDVWSNIVLNGETLPNITNQFVLKPIQANIIIGSQSQDPSEFGFSFYGINQNEKILNTDIRKVGVVVKRAYSTNTVLQNVQAFYRIYVMEGQTEVQVQDWTKINRTPNEFYFIFDMRDKIPNEYFVDIRVNTNGEKDTYKKQLTFQIVNKK